MKDGKYWCKYKFILMQNYSYKIDKDIIDMLKRNGYGIGCKSYKSPIEDKYKIYVYYSYLNMIDVLNMNNLLHKLSKSKNNKDKHMGIIIENDEYDDVENVKKLIIYDDCVE